MSWFSADFICPGCTTRFSDLIDRALKDEAHAVVCPGCLLESNLTRSIGSPMPMMEDI